MKYMKKQIGLLLAACMLGGSAWAAQPVQVSLNESKYMEAPGITRMAVGNPAIADVQLLSSGDYLLVGKQTGSTSLIVWSSQGRLEYNVYVSGDDQGRASAIKSAIGYPGVSVQMMNGKVLLRGTVENQYEHDTAVKMAQLYLGEGGSGESSSVVDLLEMAHPSQIRLEAQIIEISSKDSKNLGIQYWSANPDSKGDSSVGTAGIFYGGEDITMNRGSGGWFGNHISSINATLQALINNGKARILSRPSITTMSGETANILIGGRIPIPISQDGDVTIEYREYGIKLNIEPKVDSENKITAKVHAEVSTLDSSHGVKIASFEVPGIASREADTVINVHSGMTMAIGGLLNSEDSKNVSKIPLLGDIPIIGQFFRHTSTTRDNRELMILITPTVVSDTSPTPMSQRFKKTYEFSERMARNREDVNTARPVEQGTEKEERDIWGDKPGETEDTVILEEKAPPKEKSYLLKVKDAKGADLFVPLSEEDYQKHKDNLQIAEKRKGKEDKASSAKKENVSASEADAQRERIRQIMNKYSGK